MFLHTQLGAGIQRWALPAVLVALLAACAQTNEAPVESRGGFGRTTDASGIDPATLPGAENAGKPGYYTVRPGDTLIRIGLEHGQSWKDIARWSNLQNPDIIEVGQVVRVVPPGAAGGTGAGAVASSGGSIQTTTLPPAGSASSNSDTTVTTTPAGTTVTTTTTTSAAGNQGFIWPAAGTVVAKFNAPSSKGISIAGKAGDPIVAAADGRVMYVGSELRGYGQLVIVKHNETYLTAYAHNQKILVKEEQAVKKGQKIAEMGNSDADRVKLYFEVRRQGQPVDPMGHLPAR